MQGLIIVSLDKHKIQGWEHMWRGTVGISLLDCLPLMNMRTRAGGKAGWTRKQHLLANMKVNSRMGWAELSPSTHEHAQDPEGTWTGLDKGWHMLNLGL